MILITGFEPFDNADINPSFEAVKRLPDNINGNPIIKLELPVVFGEAAAKIIAVIEKESPDAIVMTGVAAGRDKITPEVIAINLADARIPDNAGISPKMERISADGPDGLFSTLPVNQMVRVMEDAGFKAGLSFSAGTYVCNDTFYRVNDYVRAHGMNIPCGFIHVPALKGMDNETDMDLDDLTGALKLCLDYVWKKWE